MIQNGDEIGGHKITGELGRGGMGVVYKAYDKTLERPAAIKMMLADQATETNKKRFIREAAAIARCNHPGIINVYSYGEQDGLPYFVMEYVDGKPLFSFLELARTLKTAKNLEELRTYGYIQAPSPADKDLPYFLRPLAAPPLDDEDYEGHAAALVSSVADALYEAHSLGILHRDIKPSNILIGKKGPPKLADFGLAKLKGASDITAGQPLLGTLKYMPPEVFSDGEITPASDIYSLGTLFYELLTLEHPFTTENTAAFIKAVTQDPCPEPAGLNPAISPALNLVIMKCLARNPADRFQNAHDLADAIRLGVRPKGLKTQIFDGIKTLLSGSDRTPPQALPEQEAPPEAAAADRLEAQRLADEATRLLFAEYATTKALNLTADALELDPGCLDAYFMLTMISAQLGIGTATARALPKLKRLTKTAPSPAGRARAGVMVAYLEGSPGWIKEAEKYLKTAPDDVHALYLAARGQMVVNNNFRRAREHADRIEALMPESNLEYWFIDLNRYTLTGDLEKVLETTRLLTARFPGVTMLRVGLVQRLMEAGRLDEAEREAGEALKLDPAHDFLNFFAAEIKLHRRDYQGAADGTRKFIGIAPDEIKYYSYHKLYLISLLRGDREQALKYLEIARNLAPELDLKSSEEVAAAIAGLRTASPAGGLEPRHLEFSFRKGKELLLRNLTAALNNVGGTSSEIYILDPDERPRAVRDWFFFNMFRRQELRRTKLTLAAPPLSSFSDSGGAILKADFQRIESVYGKYSALVEYAEPLKPNSAGLITAETDLEGRWQELPDGALVLQLDETMEQMGWKCRIVALPEGTGVISLSEEPSEDLTEDGTRYLVYSRFFYENERFRLTARFRQKPA